MSVSDNIKERIAKFHAHLDDCKQCRNHPFELCPLGASLLHDAAVPKKETIIENAIETGKKYRVSGPSNYFELKYGNPYPVIEIEEELDFHKNFSPAAFLYLGRVLAEGKREFLSGKTYYGHIEGSGEGEFVHESELTHLVTDIMSG